MSRTRFHSTFTKEHCVEHGLFVLVCITYASAGSSLSLSLSLSFYVLNSVLHRSVDVCPCRSFGIAIEFCRGASGLHSMLAFKQSFTSSRRSHGFMNALKVIPTKTLQMYMEAGAGKSFSGGIAREYGSMKLSIEKKLQEGLAPTLLVVDDVSYQHAGHAGVEKGATETHFNVKVVSEKFTGSSLIKRHRLVYDLLDEELKNGVHALSLVTKSPSEPV